ncbi:protein spaetzle 5 isoform X2 [Stomoxys calcitrans]|uniref:protein spaetzle 5 isoform X2 n=1 Tax=Stomoxys calcitrans TaxID=35570 RepID=UPI0027E32B6A|nr:protein spaetzle 5 isoform X2 [Stomoxys calcitrans]
MSISTGTTRSNAFMCTAGQNLLRAHRQLPNVSKKYVIKHLVHKWGYEAKNLLVDETWDDFAAVAWHDTPVFYDPAYIFPQHNHGKDFNGYNYETPPFGASGGSGSSSSGVGSTNNYNDDHYQYTKSSSTTEGPTFLLYTSAGQRLNFNKNQMSSFGSSNSKTTPNNPTLWLKRIVRDIGRKATDNGAKKSLIIDTVDGAEASTHQLSTRDVSLNMDLLDIVGVDRGLRSRVRRQSPGRTSLCPTTSQFITPQAALNSKGNWMFVVNEASTARQMVKAELCASNTCTNLCQLPNGYNSRCEQKFVQKRLIALQGNGQNLYTDSFWFPSCCVCTISAN